MEMAMRCTLFRSTLVAEVFERFVERGLLMEVAMRCTLFRWTIVSTLGRRPLTLIMKQKTMWNDLY